MDRGYRAGILVSATRPQTEQKGIKNEKKETKSGKRLFESVKKKSKKFGKTEKVLKIRKSENQRK
jgi:hypothetical protein